jgi:ribosomal protein S18 acetylase RimI-like enzyme
MYTIRQATIEDAELITQQRRGMFLDLGFADDDTMKRKIAEFLPWVQGKMAASEYLAWLAMADDQPVAGLGLWLIEWPPHLYGLARQRGYILNVYTHPDHRRKGLARELTRIAVDWCATHGIDFVFLHASPTGRLVYEGLGFQPGSEMRLRLPVSPA